MWEWLAGATLSVPRGNLLMSVLMIFVSGVSIGILIAVWWGSK